MSVKAREQIARINRGLVTAIVCISLSSPIVAQIKFAGGEQSATGDVAVRQTISTTSQRGNPFRGSANVQPAQFQEIAPVIPDAASEADPPSAGPVELKAANGDDPAPEPIGEGVVISEGLPGEIPYDVVESPFDPNIVADESSMLYSTNNWFRRGIWYTQQSVVALLRTEGEEVVVSADQTEVSTFNRPVLTSKTTDPTYEAGMRLTVGRFLGQDVANRDYSVEFSFLGLFEYKDRAVLEGAAIASLFTALGPGNDFNATFFGNGFNGVDGNPYPGFSQADRQGIIYESDFNSFEANFRMMARPLRDRLALQPNGSWIRYGTASNIKSLILGMRVMSINELFRFESEGPTLGGLTDSGTAQVRTSNDMVGVQGGGEFMENYTNWSLGMRFKGGLMYNFADRRSFQARVINGNSDFNDQNLTRGNVAGVIEAGVVTTYQLRTNLVARFAYDAMYVTGIATAPENMRLGDTFPNFEVTHDAVFHGMSLGFEMLW